MAVAAATVTPVAEALNANGAAAERAGFTANARADAYETTRPDYVSQQEIADMRAVLAELAPTDALWFKGPVVAATQGYYDGMWEQNRAAVETYQPVVSAATQQLDAWQQPQQALLGGSANSEQPEPAGELVDTRSQVQEHRERAAQLREYAVTEAVAAQEAEKAYRQYRHRVRIEDRLATHDQAVARHCENLARLHSDLARLNRDVHLGWVDPHILIDRYRDLFSETRKGYQSAIERTSAYYCTNNVPPERGMHFTISDLWAYHASTPDWAVRATKTIYSGSRGESRWHVFQRADELFELSAQNHELHTRDGAASYRLIQLMRQSAHKHTENARRAWDAAQRHQGDLIGHIVDVGLSLQWAYEHDRVAAELEAFANAEVEAPGWSDVSNAETALSAPSEQ